MKTSTKQPQAGPKYTVTLTENHRYMVNGKQKPGVTTILKVIDKPALMYWSAGIVRDMVLDNPDFARSLKDQGDYHTYRAAMDAYMARKGDVRQIGTDVHEIISHWFKGEMDKIDIENRDEKIQSCYAAFLSWANSHELEMLGADVMVYHDIEDYAGSLDWVGRVDGVLTVIDYKTGKGVYAEAKLQVAAYAKAWERTNMWSHPGTVHATPVEQGMVIRVGKEDGAFEEATMTKAELLQSYKGFQAANNLFAVLKDLGRKNGRD